jgi:hypothetical protein
MMLMMMTGFNRKPVTVEQPEGENKSQSHQVHASFCFFFFTFYCSCLSSLYLFAVATLGMLESLGKILKGIMQN